MVAGAAHFFLYRIKKSVFVLLILIENRELLFAFSIKKTKQKTTKLHACVVSA
jgi:hypothetical protein